MKDAASAAIYGSKASNGVILITTKRGKTGKPRISYNGYVGFQKPTEMIDRISSYDYARLYSQSMIDEGLNPRFNETDIENFRMVLLLTRIGMMKPIEPVYSILIM